MGLTKANMFKKPEVTLTSSWDGGGSKNTRIASMYKCGSLSPGGKGRGNRQEYCRVHGKDTAWIRAVPQVVALPL